MPHLATTPLSHPALASRSPTIETWLALPAALLALTKPRLAVFSVLSAFAAYAATMPAMQAMPALTMLLGTTLAAGGALSLNQWWERKTDALMRRTRSRPLPSQTITPRLALGWSLGLSVSGVVVLAWQVNALSAAFAAATILIYGVVYTPLKRRTRWATEIGAISGALPALLGGAAAGELWSVPAWTLASILLFWQMPHFFAIGWMHRDDYRRAGFPLLPAVDPSGERTAAWSLGYTIVLVAAALAPWLFGLVGPIYGIVSTLAGGGMLWRAGQFCRKPLERDRTARALFVSTIIYLPVVMTALMIGPWL